MERTNMDNIDTKLYGNKHLDIAYGNHADQKMDLYLPENGTGPYPVLIFLHGGAFMFGDKQDFQVRPFLKGLERGYGVISANYRLAVETKYPEPLFDVKAVVAWVKEKGREFGLDGQRIALVGESAGAYYAVMAAATQNRREFDGSNPPDTVVQAVVDLYGPTDFTMMKPHFEESGVKPLGLDDLGDLSPEEVLLGASYEQILGLFRFSNPILYVDENMPPILIQHGKMDGVVPYQQSTILAEAIKKQGGKNEVTLELFDEFEHADPAFETDEKMDRIFLFLDKHLK